MKRIPFWLPLLFLALMAILTELYLTRQGPGVSGDAVHYMDGARNLLSGHGYARSAWDGHYRPITGFPPLFSVVLAALTPLSGSPLEAGRWLNAALLGANLFLAGWLVHRVTRSAGAAALTGSFILFARDILLIHAWVMSEALYICLTLLGLLLAQMVWEGEMSQSRRWAWLAPAGSVAGLTVTTRYVGFALLGAAGLGVWWFTSGGGKRRLASAAVFGVTSLLPVAAWLGRNAWVAGNLTARDAGGGLHPPSRQLLVVFFDEISSWLVPNELHFAWRLRLLTFGLFCLAGLALFAWNFIPKRLMAKLPFPREHDEAEAARKNRFLVVVGTYIVFYLIIIFLNSLALDASTSEGGMRRYLTPVFFAALIWVIPVFHRFAWEQVKLWGLRLALAILALGLLAVYGFQAVSFVRAPGYVFGYTHLKNDAPDLQAALQAIPPDRTILTNDYEAIYYLAERPPLALPRPNDNFTRQANPEYEAQMQRVDQLLQEGAVLVVINEESDPDVAAITPRLVRWQTFGRVTFYVLPEERK